MLFLEKVRKQIHVVESILASVATVVSCLDCSVSLASLRILINNIIGFDESAKYISTGIKY